MNIIKEIEQWQKDRLLDKQEFDEINEYTNIIEELYEMIGIHINEYSRNELKQFNDIIINTAKNKSHDNIEYIKPTEEDRIDALFDICVFAIGGMLKLGYEPECVFKEGIKHISSRTGSIVDGKFQKDTNVKTYEPQYDKCKR